MPAMAKPEPGDRVLVTAGPRQGDRGTVKKKDVLTDSWFVDLDRAGRTVSIYVKHLLVIKE